MHSSFGYKTRILFTALLTVSAFFVSVHVNNLPREKRSISSYNDLETLKSIGKRPTSCLVENTYEPEGVVFLFLKDNSKDERELLRLKWHKAELKCHYKMVFVSSTLEKYENDDLSDVISLESAEEERNVQELQRWTIQHCGKAKYIAVVHNVTQDTPRSGGQDFVFRIIPGKDITSEQVDFHHRQCMANVAFQWTGESSASYRADGSLFSVTDTDLPAITVAAEAMEAFEKLTSAEKSMMLKEDQGTIINPDNLEYVITQPDLCTGYRMYSPPFVFIAVHSAVDHWEHRKKIRATWGHPDLLQKLGGFLLFFLGSSDDSAIQTKVKNENEMYHDIIQGSFTDHYRQLTEKHSSIFKFFLDHCEHIAYHFLMKTDDDVVIDLETTLSFMKNLTDSVPTRCIYCYHLEPHEEVPRKKTFKWYIKYDEYPGKVYPPFCYGNGYLFTKDLVRPMYETALRTPQFWVDDVYFTGFVARNIQGVRRVQLPYQRPIVPKVMAPEDVLAEKKWIVHTWSDPVAFDYYWPAFQSRHNETVRQSFVAGVRYRTGKTLPNSAFDVL